MEPDTLLPHISSDLSDVSLQDPGQSHDERKRALYESGIVDTW